MQTITPAETKLRSQEIRKRIKNGEIFIYPTDTIYGLGCDATNSKAVQKIREIKKRPDTPFSVIVPSKEWIKENCELDKESEEWIKKLPGPYTLILKTKNTSVAPEVAPNKDSLGIRIPDHWIAEFIQWLGMPIITTSVNITNAPFLTKIEDLESKPDIKRKIGFALYEGEKPGKPSKIIHLEQDKVKVQER